MRDREKALKVGLVAVILALCLRLGDLEPPVYLQEWGKPLMSVLVFAQTGWAPHYPEEETAATDAPTEPEPVRPVFSPEELADLRMMYGGDYRPELDALLCAELSWQLRSAAPTVLILHTHATESYTPSPGWEYTASGNYRTEDPEKNMIAVGAHLVKELEKQGIHAIHDRTLHDEPSYSGAYSSSRKAIQEYLEAYPTITMVLDLHRDSSSSDKPLATHAKVDGQDAAQIMLVIGTDEGGKRHPNWQENLALGLKLAAVLQREDPGICRPIYLRQERFNMDLSTGCLLVEMGATGNTHPEVLATAGALARAIGVLADGSG